MTTREEVPQRHACALTGRKRAVIASAQRICRPIAYAAILTGAVWTASSATAIAGGPDPAHAVEKLRLASSVLVGGLLLAALAHWDKFDAGERLNNAGDHQ